MPDGKPAGVRCIHLSHDLLCSIYHDPEKPDVCNQFKFDPEICGKNAEEAKNNIIQLESKE